MAEIRTLHKEIADQHKEIEKLVKEIADQQKKTDKQLKKAHGEFNSKWGRLVEYLVSGKLVELLRERGIDDVTLTQPRQNVSYPQSKHCLLYTSPSPRDRTRSRMPSSA